MNVSPDLTIHNLRELPILIQNLENIRAVIFDIDGTLSRGKIVAKLFSDVLAELSIKTFDIQSTLGSKNWFTQSWLSQNLSITSAQAEQVIELTKERFLQLSVEQINEDLYEETVEILSELKELGLVLGIFTMRHWQLALHQITYSSVSNYLDQQATLISNSSMRITGSHIEEMNSKNGFAEKVAQLELHLKDLPNLHSTEIAVVGDIITTDIASAKQLEMVAILIQR